MSKGSESAVPLQRVVAVVLALANGREQTGTGYLVGGRRVLTAAHCTRDRATKMPPQSIRVIGATGGEIEVSPDAVTASPKLDLAVIDLPDDAPWQPDLTAPSYARVHRDRAGVVSDCTAIGYPLYQRDPMKHTRGHGELHGTIYQTDEAESGRLLMREPFAPGPISPQVAPSTDAGGQSMWGGLSGALVFHGDHAIGVVVEHHPRQGASAVQLCGFDRLLDTAATDEETRAVAALLGLTAASELPFATASSVQPLSELVEIAHDGNLPTVADLEPYRLGATVSAFGTSQTYGQHDPYVPRTFDDVDARLAAALDGSRMVLVIGPSKAGKTRTCCEALRSGRPDARVLAPKPGTFEQLAAHPRLQTSTDTIVIWLDDLDRYLTHSHPLTPQLHARLTGRPGRTIIVATLRTEARDRLATDSGELTRDTRLLLAQAETIELSPTRDDDEQAAAAQAYPGHDLQYGLGAVLAGAPELLRRYDAAEHNDPLQHAVIGVVIDWARVGRPGPIPEPLLKTVASDRLWDTRPDLETPDEAQLTAAVLAARTRPESAGRVAALTTHTLDNKTRGYRPFDYLVAADDGQDHPTRPIPNIFWRTALRDADAETASEIGFAAYTRHEIPTAIDAFIQSADGGDPVSMTNLGVLFADRDPPDLDGARRWWERAADAGHREAMFNLGMLFEYRDPPDLDGARRWYERAADAGHRDAMFNLGLLHANLDPPQLDSARYWYKKAADAGHADAMFNLGLLFEYRDPPDLDAAYSWYLLAATAFNHPGAMTNLGLLHASLDPPQLDSARYWYEKAADAGHRVAMFNLGVLHASLDPPQLDSARDWYEKAADAGHRDAMFYLGVLSAELEPPDLDAAHRCYRQLVDAGDDHLAETLLEVIQRHDG